MASKNVNNYSGNDWKWDKIAFDRMMGTGYADNQSNLIKMKRFAILSIEYALTDKQKQVYLMRNADKKSVCQIAKELGLSQASVYKHLTKANLRMEKYCELFITATTGKSYVENLVETLKREIKCMPKDAGTFVEDYYINMMSIKKIAWKYDLPEHIISSTLETQKRKLKLRGLGKVELQRIKWRKKAQKYRGYSYGGKQKRS